MALSCPSIQHFRVLAAPVSVSCLLSLSTSCNNICSLTVSLSRPVCFSWVVCFRSLKNLSVILSGRDLGEIEYGDEIDCQSGFELESLCLSGVRAGDFGPNWLWRNCKKLRILQFKSCESVGDNSAFSGFVEDLESLQEVELRTCRGIVDVVLFNLAEYCASLYSLLIYDGGSREGLLHFIRHCKCNLRKIDLRLPLDLDNRHLLGIAENFGGLSSFRLQSCCLVTGDGLKRFGVALSNVLEELVLINCDVIERETGLLSTLGQSLRHLKKLDLSYNDMLLDKELVSILVSCNYLREMKLRGCSGLTSAATVSMSKNCKLLESLDMRNCSGIEEEAIQLLVMNSPRLRRLYVEEYKLSDVVKNKVIEVLE